MIVPLLLSLAVPRGAVSQGEVSQGATDAKLTYAYAVGERSTYEFRGELPIDKDGPKGQLRGLFEMRVLSVGEDGTAEVEFAERDGTLEAMGQKMPLPKTEPSKVRLDRQGYLLTQPKPGAFSSIAILMFGVPGELLSLGTPFEWKPGGEFPTKGTESATVKLSAVKDGKATLERSIDAAGGQKLRIVSTHEVASGRLTAGEISSEGGGFGEVKLALTLKKVEKAGR